MQQSPNDEQQQDVRSRTTTFKGKPQNEPFTCFIVALFSDGFVCRHLTRKSGWVEGFAQSYDSATRYFLDCLERGFLSEEIAQLIEPSTPRGEYVAELWDFSNSSTVLCPLTSGDLPRWGQHDHIALKDSTIRRLVLRVCEHNSPRPQISKPHYSPPGSEEFPQLCNADFEALTTDEFSNLAIGGSMSDLLQIDSSFNNILSNRQTTTLRSGGDTQSEASLQSTVTTECNSSDSKQDSTQIDCMNLLNDELMELITPKRSGTSIGTDGSELWSLPSLLSPNASKTLKKLSSELPDTSISNFPNDSDDTISVQNCSILDWIDKPPLLSSLTPSDDLTASNEKTDVGAIKNKKKTKKKMVTRRRKKSPLSNTQDILPPSTILNDTTTDVNTEGELESGTLSSDESEELIRMSERLFEPIESLLPPPIPVPLESPTSLSSTKSKKRRIQASKLGPTKPPTPLPATHHFLTKLNGKHHRNYRIDELHDKATAWQTMKQLNRFFQSAQVFERRHSQFLQININSIMKVGSADWNQPNMNVGSMSHLSMQLQEISAPTDVIAFMAANAAAEAAGLGYASRRGDTGVDVERPRIRGGRRRSRPMKYFSSLDTMTPPPYQRVNKLRSLQTVTMAQPVHIPSIEFQPCVPLEQDLLLSPLCVSVPALDLEPWLKSTSSLSPKFLSLPSPSSPSDNEDTAGVDSTISDII